MSFMSKIQAQYVAQKRVLAGFDRSATANIGNFLDHLEREVYASKFTDKWLKYYDNSNDLLENFGFRKGTSIEDARDERFADLSRSISRHAKEQDGELKIYRTLSVNSPEDFVTSLKSGKTISGFDGIGIYWSWWNEAASAHWGEGGKNLVVVALAPMSAIDFPETALLSMDNEEECEVRMLHGKDLEIVDVLHDGDSLLGSPVTINTGSGKTKSKGQQESESARLKAVGSHSFDNWVPLTTAQIGQEYEWEYISHQKHSWLSDDPWPTVKDFERAVKKGKVERLTEAGDRKIGNRSRCDSIADLKDLTSGYQFPRDVDRIVDGFETNAPIPYPIVIQRNGKRWVMSGNTRLDAAFILGIEPKILVLSPTFKEKVLSRYNIALADIEPYYEKIIAATRDETIDYLKRMIEHAPEKHGKVANDLFGWDIDGVYVCKNCASRIIGRGCSLPKGAKSVWDRPSDKCCLCGC